jgi:hypothetical protein
MTDAEWSRGWGELTVAYPQRDEASEQTALRASLYRKHLDDLDPRAWLHAVTEAIRTEAWFPAVARLRECAGAWREPVLPSLPMTEEEREERREAARAGLRMIEAAVYGARKSEEPRVTLPDMPEPRVVTVSDERLDVLRRQAEQIQ